MISALVATRGADDTHRASHDHDPMSYYSQALINQFQQCRWAGYLRKSSKDNEDKQIRSLEGQREDLQQMVEQFGLQLVADFLEESCSAFEMGRPLFSRLLADIEARKINALIVWHPNRIARNYGDGGRFVQLMKDGYLKYVLTVHGVFTDTPRDREYLMTEFTRATRDSDDKSEAVKRGYRTKLRAGYIPSGRLPEGYMHQRNDQWQMINVPDPERFPKLQKAIRKILYGHLSPLEALDYLNFELGYLTKRTRRTGGASLSKSAWYKLLSDSIYTGDLSKWGYDEQGDPYIAKYEPLLTIDEYEKLQIMLGKPGGVRRRQRKDWPYTGFITCGTCGSAAVMEEKWQRICSSCRYKFVITPDRIACPQCNLSMTRIRTPLLHYVYLRCGKSKKLANGSKCSERSVRLEDFERQVDTLLSQIEIPTAFSKWVIKWLKKLHTQAAKERNESLEQVQKKYNQTYTLLQNLARMRANNELDADEFRLAKQGLMHDKRKLKQRLDLLDQQVNHWMHKVEQLFEFAEHARHWFAHGTNEQKRLILKSLGSNLTLYGQKLRIEALKPFVILKEIKQTEDYEKITFELKKKPEVSIDSLPPLTDFPDLLAGVDAIRTYTMSYFDRNSSLFYCFGL